MRPLRWLWGLSVLALLSVLAPGGRADAVTVPGNYGTIQAAIDAVAGGSLPSGTTIDVQPGVYPEALAISGTAASMTIRAASGTGTATVNAAGRGVFALLIIGASGNIRIEGLTFTGGTGNGIGSSGGGLTLFNSSPAFVGVTFTGNSAVNGGGANIGGTNATFDSCIFQNNAANQFGGGLVITGGSRPLFTNTAILNNVSGTGNPFGSGGGIHSNDSSPTFMNSTIVGNTARFAGGGILQLGVFGSPNGPATLTMANSEVSSNTARRFNPNPGTS